MIYVDTNVMIDVMHGGSWSEWSLAALANARLLSAVVIGPIVFGELAGNGAALESIESALDSLGVRTVAMDAVAGHRAGTAHHAFRSRGGGREKILADFLIGGHASALGATLLTRDPRWYRRYFPELELITPEDDNG